MKTILLMAVLSSFALAQGIAASGGHMTKGGKLVWGATGPSSSHLVVANVGGTTTCGETCVNGSDSGNGGQSFATPFVTGSATPTLSPTFVTWIGTPQAATWGIALYGDCSGTGTVTTVGTAVTWASGTQFCFPTTNGTWAGNDILLCSTQPCLYVGGGSPPNGSLFSVSSVNSATSITLGSSPASATYFYAIYTPGQFICGNTSGSTPASGWNSLAISGCPSTLSPNTMYWVTQYTANGTQNQGTTGDWSFCPGTLTSSNETAAVTPWPTLLPTWSNGTAGAPPANGCYASYVQLTYTSQNTYDVVSLSPGNCDSGSPCIISIPNVQAGHSLIVGVIGSVSQITSGVTVQDCTGVTACGSSTDTFTSLGTCPTGVGGGFNDCMFYVNRATAGINNVTISWTGAGGKGMYPILEVAGTAVGSTHQAAQDSVYLTSTPWTSANGITTTVANELAVGFAVNSHLYTGYQSFTLSAGGSWNLLYSGGTSGSGANSIWGIFDQTLTTTTTLDLQGTYNDPGHLALLPELMAIP